MAYIYSLADTWNAAGTTFTAIKMSVTDTASAAGSLLMDLQVGGSSKFSVAKDGAAKLSSGSAISPTLYWNQNPGVFTNTGFFEAGVGIVGFGSGNAERVRFDGSGLQVRSVMSFGSTGGSPDLILARDAANTLAQRNGVNAQAFNLYNTYTDASNYERGRWNWVGNELRFGPESAGTGSSRSLGLYVGNIRYQIIGSSFTQFDQPIYMNTTGIATGVSGFKIGTATTQGLGFWNATPSAQPTAVADATDAASVITQLNALLSRMRTIGLIAT